MSSQFSYELDERQIRIMMQDAELEGNDALWSKFESLTGTDTKSSVSIGQLVPSFNLSISRSIVVPVLFVALIGGLSAMLFSFVDFKKKESIDKETPLVANPDNFEKQEVIVEKTEKPKENKVIPVVKDSALNTETSAAIVTTSPAVISIPEVKKEEPVKTTEEKPKEVAVSTIEPKKETPIRTEKKKRTRKVRSEILPTINATTTTNLNEGATEPELDLK
ncbi:MAG: hypothetical protein K0S53_2971 [Bacteroidetes bacterium]|nr:hypothetical protein [Bacteroidota bacterium]MDF2453406.1 hypothetical protein [Bacteroidota bacterium]